MLSSLRMVVSSFVLGLGLLCALTIAAGCVNTNEGDSSGDGTGAQESENPWCGGFDNSRKEITVYNDEGALDSRDLGPRQVVALAGSNTLLNFRKPPADSYIFTADNATDNLLAGCMGNEIWTPTCDDTVDRNEIRTNAIIITYQRTTCSSQDGQVCFEAACVDCACTVSPCIPSECDSKLGNQCEWVSRTDQTGYCRPKLS
jgi:hypothetical protein